MVDTDLMILFNGFIRNYINLGLNENNQNSDIIKQENKYFVTIGKLLGFNVVHKLDFKEIIWKEYKKDIEDNASVKINIFRENDLTRDLLALHNLLEIIKKNPKVGYIQLLETSSIKRIEFLNNIIKTSNLSFNTEILIIYINKDILKGKTYYYAYLFKNREIIKGKIGIVSSDKDGNLKGDF